MGLLSKDALLAAASPSALPRETLEIPELGGSVILQGMSGIQRDRWEISLLKGRGPRKDLNTENLRARLAVQCLIHEDGTRMFTDAEATQLGALRVDVLNRIYERCQRLCGVSDQDLDELGKSSGAADGSDSPTS